ncbi:hypothetical protein JTB14_036384 [Gonioctena quinquepunctata]|nr:hypothetical protein JTB14_036384 [Gonioctena quinquepunctata]
MKDIILKVAAERHDELGAKLFYVHPTKLGNTLNLEDWGWKKTKTTYLAIRTTEPSAPRELLTKIYCTCTTTNCGKKCECKKAGLRCSRSCKNCLDETCFNAADIVEKNNEEDYDNLEDLEHADEETVESEYIVKPGYLQVIWGIFGDGGDDDVGDHDAETVRDADEQSEEIPTAFKKTQKEEIHL